MAHIARNLDLHGIQGRQGSAVAPLDAAIQYIRARGLRLLPTYLVAMLPMSVLALLLIDAISVQHRSAVAVCCAGLVAATLWRWAWLARMQQRVQQDIEAQAGPALRRRLLGILLVRLYANILLTWGSLLVFPAFYGLFAGSFAAPMRLARDGSLWGDSWDMALLVHHGAGRLLRMLIAVNALGLALVVAVFAMQYVLGTLILPGLLGVDTTGAALTMASTSWILSIIYFIFMFLDFFWTVAGVFLYYDCRSRRTGSDLRARLQLLRGVTV